MIKNKQKNSYFNYDVDNTEYNKYFEQAANAIPVRMAILRNLITHRYE